MDTTTSIMDASFAAPAATASFEMPATTASFDMSSTGAPAEESFLRSPIFIGVVVVIALAIVGVNVFAYLGEGTTVVAGGVMPFIERVTGDLSWFVNKFTDNTTTGTKGAVDVAGSTVKAGAAVPHEIVAGDKGAVVSQQNKKKIDATSAANAGSARPEQADPENSMQTALDSAPTQTQQGSQNPEPASVGSKSSGPGYCYIGEDQGHRSCISVSDTTKCMSGDVYANLDACQREA
jgi:hypothetical protein